MTDTFSYIHLDADFKAVASVDSRGNHVLTLDQKVSLFCPPGGGRLVFVPAGFRAELVKEEPKCPACDGAGLSAGSGCTCSTCHGTGKPPMPVEKKEEVAA